MRDWPPFDQPNDADISYMKALDEHRNAPPLLHWAARLVRAVVQSSDPETGELVRMVALEMRDWLRCHK